MGEATGQPGGEGVRAVLVDVDGVLVVSWRALPGAVEALARVRAAGLQVALLTNTTTRTRASVTAALTSAGFTVGAEDVVTAPVLTAAYLNERYPGARCLLLNSGDIREDLPGVTFVGDGAEGENEGEDEAADVVVVGGAGPEFDYGALNRAFGHLHRGARLVAMHRNLYWRTDAGLQLDTGAFLPGLEAATGVTAEVVGKPSAAFFATALARLGIEPAEALMVGDDVESDVLAAQHHGITGALVRTGKYDPRAVERAGGTPDHVLDSVADVPALLGLP